MTSSRSDIELLLYPGSVAVIGTVKRDAPEQFLAPLRQRFGNSFHIVDPRGGGDLAGVPIHQSIAAVRQQVDLAVIDVKPAELITIAKECIAAGVRLLLVVTGLTEIGRAGQDIEAELVEIVRSSGARMVGPNGSLNLFEPMPPAPQRIGKIGLITQSGHMGRVIIQSHRHGVAFSRWIPTGNEADLEAADFIEYLASDPRTAVIAGYFEGFRSGATLRRALAAAAAADKSVVMIKVGRHQAATRMAETHSAHLTGSDAVIDGLFRQYGVIRVEDVDELIETAALCAKLNLRAAGTGVALYGISGGAVALMADSAESHGVAVPALGLDTQDRLHEILPADLGVANPVDPGNLYRTGTLEQRRAILDVIGSDPAIDVVVCALTGVIKGITDDFVSDIVSFRDTSDKAVVTTWNTWELETPAYAALVESGIPIFRSFRGCFTALHAVFERARRRQTIIAREATAAAGWEPSSAPPRQLRPVEAAALLKSHGIEVADEREIGSPQDLPAAVAHLAFPLVLKAHAGDIVHKSDAGLVRLGLTSPAEVEAAYAELAERASQVSPQGPIAFQLQGQIPAGTELIVGVIRDATLGPALVVGSGGILVEIVGDVSVRPLPITLLDAEEMLRELRCYPILEGVRGAAPADLQAIVKLLLNVGDAAMDPRNRILELDLNPVLAGPHGAIVVDSVVIVDA